MATQTSLPIPTQFRLDRASRDAGRRGLAKARAALAEASTRAAAQRRHDQDHQHDQAA